MGLVTIDELFVTFIFCVYVRCPTPPVIPDQYQPKMDAKPGQNGPAIHPTATSPSRSRRPTLPVKPSLNLNLKHPNPRDLSLVPLPSNLQSLGPLTTRTDDKRHWRLRALLGRRSPIPRHLYNQAVRRYVGRFQHWPTNMKISTKISRRS